MLAAPRTAQAARRYGEYATAGGRGTRNETMTDEAGGFAVAEGCRCAGLRGGPPQICR